ncbi:Methyltransferase domain-containing protein [Cyclobacterium lianum]|uniref:Methyltransferase domain-containing protein n=1 Tax=Cyclobacterium lianum TaxID=388280 RepID=A0A1M7JV78_9BACT|nr:class I SAM-dependent methyltransferase [Cyclobacterium lianum]SHM56811.1 Methyltransferase domain-containing protein [Cyclobacterium lianum]
MSESISDWKKWGEKDPYYGVLSDEKYRMAQLSEERLKEFFDSGEDFVAESRQRIKQWFGSDIAQGSILDFGCGVGRLAIPFARMTSREVWGLDISEAIVQRACEHRDRMGLHHLHIKTYNGRELDGLPAFDFINAFIVFQHIEFARGMRLMRQLLDMTREGGIVQVQVTYGHRLPRLTYANFYMRTKCQAYNFIYSSLKHRRLCSEPVMQMNHYPPEKLFRLFASFSKQVHVEFTDHGGHLGAIYALKKSGKV